MVPSNNIWEQNLTDTVIPTRNYNYELIPKFSKEDNKSLMILERKIVCEISGLQKIK